MRLLYAASISLLLAFPLTAQAVDRGVADFPVITPASDDYWVLLDTSTSSRYSKVATSGIRAAIGLAATDNPTFNSINITGSNIASANKQVTKAWTTGIGYTTNVTSVIHGGKHYICTSTHTAGSTTEPGVGASWATVWTVGTLGSATIYTQDTEPAGGVDGDIWIDTNGTTGQRLYTYEDAAWVAQAGGGGGYTNLTSFISQTPWRLFYSNTDGDVVELGFGADGEYLKSNGASLAPTWSTPSGAAHDAVTIDTELSAILSLSTQQITLDSQTANYIFAAPNGSAGDPTFRALVDADIPDTITASNYLTTGGTAANSSQLESHAASYFQVALTNPIVAAGAQAITGAKTFDPSMLLMKGSSTGVTTFATANASANNYTLTFPAATGTVARTADITGTNSGTNTGDQTATTTAFTPNGSIAASNVQAAIQEVRDEAAGSDDQTAAEVAITDSGGYFTGTNVETVTQELGAKLPTGTDGTRRLILADNPSGIAPTAAAWEIYSDAGVWKMNTSGTEHTIPRSPLAGRITFTGPTAARDFALPDAAATILTSNAAVTVAQGGTGRATGTTAYSLVATGTTATGAQQTLANGAATEVLVGGGASALPVWTTATGSGAPVRGTAPSFTTSANPVSADGATLGTTALEWSDIYLAAGGVIYGENGQENSLTSSATGWTANLDLTITGSDLILGAAGVQFTGDGDGAVTLLGRGDGSDENMTINLDDTANIIGVSSSTGVTAMRLDMALQAPIVFNSYTSAQTLTAAVHNASIVQMTTADEVTLWDCETANAGQHVVLWARDAEKIEVVPASGDQFFLFAGTGIGANDELDMVATAGTKVTLMCTVDDSWSVLYETATSTDGGAAD